MDELAIDYASTVGVRKSNRRRYKGRLWALLGLKAITLSCRNVQCFLRTDRVQCEDVEMLFSMAEHPDLKFVVHVNRHEMGMMEWKDERSEIGRTSSETMQKLSLDAW